jgi:signal transduction histidine kinase
MNVYSIILLITATINAFLSFYALRYRKVIGSLSFGFLTLAASIFSLGYAFELESVALETKLRWVNFEYLGIATIPLLYWLFAIQYVGKEKWLTIRRLIILVCIPLSIILIQYTNSFHHLFYSSTEMKAVGPFSILVLGRGPLFWYHIVYANIFILAAIANFIGFIWTMPKAYHAQALVMLIGALPPWITNIIYVSGKSPMGMDLSPFGFAFSGIILGFGLFYYRLLDFIPIALENVFESMKEGAILMDKHQRLLNFNPTAQKIIKSLSKSSIGTPLDKKNCQVLYDLMNHQESSLATFQESSEEGTSYYKAEKSLVFDRNNMVIGYQILIYDITKQVVSEQILMQNEQKLIRLNAAKDKFLSIIAHDLRGPVGTIHAFLDLLTEENMEFSEQEKQQYLLMLKNTAKTTFDLLDNLLTWSRTQSGNIVYSPQMFDIGALIKESVDFFSTIAKDKKILISSEVPDNLKGYFDYNMINSVLRNLLSNAIKFTEEEGRITVSAENQENSILVSVRDTGIGISRKTLENMFLNENKQASTYGTRGEKGSGIGLDICKEFIEKHGGILQIESKEGKGSIFSFCIPAHG